MHGISAATSAAWTVDLAQVFDLASARGVVRMFAKKIPEREHPLCRYTAIN
jgi:hypothetical protein